MPLFLFNNITKKKELFAPLTPQHVGMYVCGPTVSGESHLGHARPYITFDVLYRLFLSDGYKVRYVRNITDAGHFEEEGKDAEDKISSKAVIEKLEPMELVHKYTMRFHAAMRAFNCLTPSIEPTATGHIIEQINMIETILEKGFAYVVNGSVYFDVIKYAAQHDYGILSKRKLEDLMENSRTLNNQDEKKNAVDFALWKNAPQQHLMKWKSPWGYGFPGWHIECSAMSAKYLGPTFDIHGGGMDLQFPHHECEIAQSTIAHQCSPAKYWLHNNMITINGKKMGKSYGNVITFSDLFAGTHPLITKAIAPMTIRFFILQTHYSSTLDFSMTALDSAEKAFQRLWTAHQLVQHFDAEKFNATQSETDANVLNLLNKIDKDIYDDVNTAKVLASFFEIIPHIYSIHHKNSDAPQLAKTTIVLLQTYFKKYIETILGLQAPQNVNRELAVSVNLLLELRNKAKQEKDYATSDKIRKELEAIKIVIKDNKDGTTDWGY